MSIAIEFIQLIFRLLMWLVLFRFWIQWAGVNFYNPIVQMVVKLSDPLCKPLRSLLPQSRRYDWSSLLTALLFSVAFWLFSFALIDINLASFNIIISRSLFLALDVVLSMLFFLLIIRAIASWIALNGQNPALDLIIQLTEPLLMPIRRLIPPSAGLDFSPMILMLLVWFTMRVLQHF